MTDSTALATLTDVDQYRHLIAERAWKGQSDGDFYPDEVPLLLAEFGIVSKYARVPRKDRKVQEACDSSTCAICLEVTHSETLEPLPDGTTVAQLKTQVFTMVRDLQVLHDWCGQGTLDALRDLGVDDVWVDEDNVVQRGV